MKCAVRWRYTQPHQTVTVCMTNTKFEKKNRFNHTLSTRRTESKSGFNKTKWLILNTQKKTPLANTNNSINLFNYFNTTVRESILYYNHTVDLIQKYFVTH